MAASSRPGSDSAGGRGPLAPEAPSAPARPALVPDRTTTPPEVFDLQQGRLANVGEVTLATSPATTTTVTHAGVSSTSCVLLMPKTDGAASLEGTNLKIVPATGSFVIHHASSSLTRTYQFVFFTGIERRF